MVETNDGSIPTTLADAMSAGRLIVLFPAIRRSMYSAVVSIAVFSILLMRFNPVGLGEWLVVRLAVSAACLVGLGLIERNGLRAEAQIRMLAGLMGVSGIVWGSIPAFVRPEAPEWQAVVVLWLFGNQTVVTAVSAPARSVFLAAISSVTLVGAVALVIGGETFGIVLAAVLLLGGAYSIAIFTSLHQTSQDAIESQWEAAMLACSLAERQAELESTNEALVDLASHDGLTGLLNRRAITERVTGGSDAETVVGRGWVFFIDIDHFKAINDTMGHRAGDEVLASVAGRWARALGDEAAVARAGGDEFVVALPPCSPVDAEQAARRLLAMLDDPIVTNAGPIGVSCSIGLTGYNDGESLAVVRARADRALYRVKAQGRGTWAIEHGAEVDDPAVRSTTGLQA